MTGGNPKLATCGRIIWYAWVTSAALIGVNISIAYLLGFDSIPEFWGM